VEQLQAWFAGRLRTFQLPLRPAGTQFQQKVWHALQQIPWGQTASYARIAADIGQPSACRAVGLANGRNPIPVIIPCHRIIGSNGQLVGYSGGLEIKHTLLAIEGSLLL
jgi:methylated-DNA-[protein]-cysteine S-methyltransferase